MDKPFSIEQGEYGLRLVLHGPWRDDFVEVMKQGDIDELVVNYARGFEGNDISFVQQIPQLTAISIVHRTIDDISGIHALHTLRSLTVHTYCKTPIDFAHFPLLERCALEWRRGVSALFACPHLKVLWINKYDKKATDAFSGMATLEHLSLANAPTEDLRGLADLKSLKFLGLYRLRRLACLHGIERLGGLVTLEIQECKRLQSLDPVGALRRLRRLLFCDIGTIPSISSLEAVRELEEVLFYGSTSVSDGQIGVLTRLPKLKNVSFQNRRHYTHKREHFSQY